MGGNATFGLALISFGLLFCYCYGLRCYTCSVDFRLEKFNISNKCIFPNDTRDLAHCSSNSKFCRAVITRVGGVFVMLHRTCVAKCHEACTERGYGIRTRECTRCCTKEPDCGVAELMKKKKK